MSNFFTPAGAALISNKDDWETPTELFKRLDKHFNFTLDPCASIDNAKCKMFFTKQDDGLTQSWENQTVFCNPPYGRDIGKWVKKCSDEAEHATIVLLIPARTDTAYFHDYIYKKAKIIFIRGRLKFEVGGMPGNPAPFPSMIVIFKRKTKKGECKE